MFVSRVVSQLSLLSKASGLLPKNSQALCSAVQHCQSAHFKAFHSSNRRLIPAADNQHQPKLWAPLDSDLEEVLVPRKLSVSPLESWLSLRYSLPPLLEALPPLEEGEIISESMVLPPCAVPLLEDGESSTPLHCKNVLEIRRRKMNRHKYRKLLKRTKFLRRRVKDVRRKKKQFNFERDLIRIARRAGLKKAPEGWTTPKIFIKLSQSKRD
ncbi:aurora kinase A-interacting protein [Triplophysa dalaica]|uniref:aurora kinase A-interacting protein n=1 Tax=Triplophysa dalaica TaxID=1582913 RepID=UPI0024DFA21C|nr:aurora kinase A-interacting protein [Triplophysa dalaica]